MLFVGTNDGRLVGLDARTGTIRWETAVEPNAKGYKITLKDNVGSTEIAYKALTSGQIDMYPEYTGVLLSAAAYKAERMQPGR